MNQERGRMEFFLEGGQRGGGAERKRANGAKN
jgi:hypothetical protein